MTFPISPLCGREAVDLYQQKTHSTAQSTGKSHAEVVVCYCTESHRFVVAHVDPRVSAGRSGRVHQGGSPCTV
jgi:hypothetical protein